MGADVRKKAMDTTAGPKKLKHGKLGLDGDTGGCCRELHWQPLGVGWGDGGGGRDGGKWKSNGHIATEISLPAQPARQTVVFLEN